ncbi:MAG TPA: hypothetical protein VNQ73_02670 [Ilumatobacter sp.]|nr:hypothetical protein [Ilumatobacter sp.]
MGATGYRNKSFTEAIRCELAGYTVLARAAGVPSDQNATWFGLAGSLGEFICLALWRTYGRGRERETVIKLVSEDMGPHDVCVPDAVWEAVTPDPAQLGEFARDWRARVSEYRRRFPQRIIDLRPGDRGRMVLLPGRDAPVRYVGRLPSGRSRCHVFDFPDEGWRRLPRGEERAQRCALVDADPPAAAGGAS